MEERGEVIERQQVITEACKAHKDDDKFAEPIREIEEQLNRRLAVAEQEMDTYVGMDWETKVNDYMTDLQMGIEELNSAAPWTPEEQHRIFLLKKELVDELVEEAIIDDKRNIRVRFRAKTIDLAVSKRILGLPNDGEIVVRL